MLCNLVLASCTNSVSTIHVWANLQHRRGWPHWVYIILSITVRQRNQALCWNYSATFFNWLFMFYKKNCQNCRMTRRHQSNWYHILRPVHLQKNVAFSSSSSTTLSAKITVVVSTAEWNSCAMHIHVHVVHEHKWVMLLFWPSHIK